MRRTLIINIFLCFSTLVPAQEKTKAHPDTSLKEVQLNEVTISATRFPEHKKFVAQQVQTINSKKIAFYNQQTAAELLTHSGNVLVQKSQLGGGSPIIRGFEANKVLIVVDGVRMNNAIYRSGHLQNILTMDNSILEKTEILFGPASVMYGSDALGGVMSFYTKNPVLPDTKGKTHFSGNAFMRYASAYNEKTGHIDLNIARNGFASLTSFTFSDFGDLRQGSNYYSDFPDWGKHTFYVERINGIDSMVNNSNVEKQVQTGYKQYDLIQKIVFKTGKADNVLNFQYSTSSDISRYDRLTETTANGVARSAQWYYGPQKRLMAAWNINLPACFFYDMAQVTTAYQDIEESRHNRNFRNSRLNHRIEKVKVGSLNIDMRKNIKSTELGIGGEVTYNKINSSAYGENIFTGTITPLDTRYPDGGNNTQSYAAYVTLLHKFSEKIIVNAGGRFTHNRLYSKFNDKTFFPFPYNDIEQSSNALTGNVGLVFLPGTGWKIAGLVSNGFRTPNVDDMTKVFESGNGTLIVPNPDVDPEKTINYELSISKIIGNKILLGSTAWYTNYHDALTAGFSTFEGSSTITYNGVTSQVVTIVNKNKAYVWGISGNIGADFNEHFSLSSVLNYTYGRIKEDPKDYPLDHVAPLFGKTGVTAKFGKLTGEVFALYNGVKDSSDYNLRGEDNHVYSADPVRGYTPAWVTANCRAGYDINKYATAQLAIENIFDKYYRVFASGLSAPGRNFVLTLRARL